MVDNSIVKFDGAEWGKAAKTLVEKISDGVGGICKPSQIVRVAKAEAKAAKIRVESDSEVTDLQRRALLRWVEEEAKKQSNIEGITRKALPQVKEDSSPQNVQDDWITNFFDKCRIVSDDDMQNLWSSVLAGEANSPGAFSKRTVNLLADLDKADAELFTSLCSFCWVIDNDIVPLILDARGEMYTRRGISFKTLAHLETLGFVRSSRIDGFRCYELPKKVTVTYYGTPQELTFREAARNTLGLGGILLTRAGQQLFPVCGSKPLAGFFEYIYDVWARRGYVPKGVNKGN